MNSIRVVGQFVQIPGETVLSPNVENCWFGHFVDPCANRSNSARNS